MNFYTKLVLSLALVAGIASGLLAFTYATTAPVIAGREVEDRAKALEKVFFLQSENGAFALTPKEIGNGVVALYTADNPDQPAYYAASGQAIGYNSTVPITLMVGFTGPAADPASLLQGYVGEEKMPSQNADGHYIVGFSVINSEETPGLGEKIKDARPPYTWTQLLTGNRPAPNPDTATAFQQQFRGKQAEALALKKDGGDLDAVTASTITSYGVIAALRDASSKLQLALEG
ncbi:MAG: FMN-binding protein [Planctomycetes bacterium]|nr:FMN-binding protein [Planctomycetota bacterium]